MARSDSEAESVIDTLDDLFVFLGASDAKFRTDHYSYPTATIGRTWPKDEFVAGSEGSPTLSGLFGKWESSMVWIENGNFHWMSGQDIHWSAVAAALAQYRRVMRKAQPLSNATSDDFDCYSRLQYLVIGKSGKTLCSESRTFAYRGRKWFDLGATSHNFAGINPPDNEWLLEGNGLMISFAASEPAYWMARVRLEPEVPGLSLITDATGIKDLLKVRNVPEGRKRKEALLHWVKDHWRQRRNDPDVEVYVRKHLRGATACTYKNYAIDVKASREDTVEAALACRERAWMRKQNPRPDIRKRLAR